MTAQPCDPPEFQPDEDDTTATAKHFLDPDPHDSTSCKTCGDVNGWGCLHLKVTVDCPSPTAAGREDRCGLYSHPPRCTDESCSMLAPASDYRHDDILHAPGGVYRVIESRYAGLRFVPLEALADGQSRPPNGAKLIVRDGEVVR